VGLARSLTGGDELLARVVANLAMDGLDDELRDEGERRREAGKGRGKLKRMRLDTAQLVQLLVLKSSTSVFEAVLDLAEEDEGQDRLNVFYLKLLVEHALQHNSFEANVAINGFAYDCSASKILRLHALLTGNRHQRGQIQVAKRRRQILEMLKENLGEWVRIEMGPHKQSRLVANERIDPKRIREVLSALVPWNAKCDLPSDVGRKRALSLNHWPHLADLHSGAAAMSRAEDPRFESNRIYAVVEPIVRGLLGTMLGIECNLRMPKFFPAARESEHEEHAE
jgi:hypothetical protein